MDNDIKKHEIVISSSINILKTFSLIALIIFIAVCILNKLYDIPRVWNISFLVPAIVIYLSSVIQLIICFWKAGIIHEKISSKSYLIFSSCITYIVFIGVIVIYGILSIILFS